MQVDVAVAGLSALVAFDAGVYALATRGAKGELERIVEPVVLLGTLLALAFALGFGGTSGAVLIAATVFSRALFDVLHLGDGNVLSIALPANYALYSMVVKAGAGALFVVFASPW
jgi:hypothetical protein